MNPYEKKFKECYYMLKSNIQNDQENIERDTVSRGKYEMY